ncbi:hypothetical protein RHGRI_014048 [Rhododendron griersonianum]|uniref:Ribosomal protein S13 n=1 Tax=Rhododendron griersonianum TaxID=479676 RepID=A0AAV6K7W1_9ERIC|nr:hypothetical protein RHGRI_014048 [Rhododendron griersonianum]
MRPPPVCRPAVGAIWPPKARVFGVSMNDGCVVQAALKYNSYRAAGRILCRRLKYVTGQGIAHGMPRPSVAKALRTTKPLRQRHGKPIACHRVRQRIAHGMPRPRVAKAWLTTKP